MKIRIGRLEKRRLIPDLVNNPMSIQMENTLVAIISQSLQCSLMSKVIFTRLQWKTNSLKWIHNFSKNRVSTSVATAILAYLLLNQIALDNGIPLRSENNLMKMLCRIKILFLMKSI